MLNCADDVACTEIVQERKSGSASGINKNI